MWINPLEKDECDDGESHGNQGERHTHITNNLQGECDRLGDIERCCTQQYGKVCEVVTFTHCD